eukprot:scaffold1182_cov396-Prasinococcus_capsulatus_cf.AAC.25
MARTGFPHPAALAHRYCLHVGVGYLGRATCTRRYALDTACVPRSSWKRSRWKAGSRAGAGGRPAVLISFWNFRLNAVPSRRRS